MKMVEITLYMDTFPGMQFKYLTAYSDPSRKSEGNTRYAITFNIPDLNQPDAEISAEAKEID